MSILTLTPTDNKLKPIIFHILNHYTYYDTEHFEELYKKGDLSAMFFAIAKGDVIQAYKNVFRWLPDDMKYEAFLDVYTRSEYNFNKLTIEILELLKNLRPKSVIEELSTYADNKGYLTIYRGECTKSTPLKKALSWTLDKECAKWFAKRFLLESEIGYVHKAKVNINNVIGFTQARDESEVIVRGKYMEIITKEEVFKQIENQKGEK